MSMANKYFKAILFFALFFTYNDMWSQTPPPPVEEPLLSIDGGILGLLALGVGYAVKKIHDNSKN